MSKLKSNEELAKNGYRVIALANGEIKKQDKYTEKDMMLGYSKIKENGGVILGDGQYIRIGYIQYTGRNVIVSIDM